jgi:hypothetical protein
MKIQLNANRRRSALTLVGLIVGCMIIIAGVAVVFLLMRLAKLEPRELPDPEAEEFMQQEYGTNYLSRDWPVHYVPMALDLVTPEPNVPVYEKVFLANDFIVEKCMDGTLTNWVTQFHWIVSGSMLTGTDENGIPWVGGFQVYSNEGITYQMKKDCSGFDIDIDPEVMATHKSMFWKVTASQ